MAKRPPASQNPRWRLYGRRKGPALSKRQAHLLERDLPRLRVRPPADAGRAAGVLDPATLFDGDSAAIWLEIGFGKGEHLAWQAARHRNIGLIGCEYYVNGVAALLAQIDDEGLDNIRIWPDDARLLLAQLAPGTVDRVFILHPDPWPKRRHAKRRIINRQVLDVLSHIMRSGGELRISTDDPVMRQWTLAQMTAHTDFLWQAARGGDWRHRPEDWPETRYGNKALSAGRWPVYLRYHKL